MKKILLALFLISFFFVFVNEAEAKYVCKNRNKTTCVPYGESFLSNTPSETCDVGVSGGKDCCYASAINQGCNLGICAGTGKKLVSYSCGGKAADECVTDASCTPPACTSCTWDNCGPWEACRADGIKVRACYCRAGTQTPAGCTGAVSPAFKSDFGTCTPPTNTPVPNNNPDPTSTPRPTATGTPAPTVTPGGPTVTPGAPVVRLAANEGTADLCKSLVASGSPLASGGTISLTATAKTGIDIKKFVYKFFNKDNPKVVSNQPRKEIMFVANTKFEKSDLLQVLQNSNTQTFSFADFDKKDLNWDYWANRPKNIIVEAYFYKDDVADTVVAQWSKFDPACRVEFKVNSVDPTPTINPNCTCTNTGCSAASVCFFDYHDESGIQPYTKPPKCGLADSLFQSVPTADQKKSRCQGFLRTKGDADGNGKIDLVDYFYYVAIKSGSKIPATVYPDFNGDNEISKDDRSVIMKTLIMQSQQ